MISTLKALILCILIVSIITTSLKYDDLSQDKQYIFDENSNLQSQPELSLIQQQQLQLNNIINPHTIFTPQPNTVGYSIGNIKSKKLLRSYNKSNLYQLNVDEIMDNKPIKLLQLIGTHYQAGYAYGSLLGKQIIQTYDIFFSSSGFNGIKRHALEMFLDWQYDNYVGMQIPYCFKQQLRGIQHSGKKQHKINGLRALFQRTLVISSYPDNFANDIALSLLDQFLRDILDIKNEKAINFIEQNLLDFAIMIKKFINKMKIQCSFFATWGSRTKGGKLYTMRNLDWNANTGINKNKIIFVWKITNQIPHTTLGFPVILGALTGMSSAGLTVHQAGLDSYRQTQLGFQWTLRLRYILMRANTLQQARQIWLSTNNTLGMNHMVASANDLATGQPVFVVQTMRNYTAWFKDNDKREDKTQFIDPKTNKTFIGGYCMKDAVFRTNHAYDPFINKYRTSLPSANSSTINRYYIIKDTFKYYQYQKILISENQALNITANVANKGGSSFYHCPQMGKDTGNNVISVMYVPADTKMYVAFEYGQADKYLTAACGVYLKIDMKEWF